ncbi:hypothetical protein [Streptomyces beigongshangae]|uniref:hypothetical protein n=1 Tax=Streptomyces beigongshangae TaxID=2841597 RepID=UPI001C8623D2|nr:hypothetical protein [Streptomyces sp. REN17]
MTDYPNVEPEWARITRWLEKNAPVSYQSLLPPTGDEEVRTDEEQLRQWLGHGFPEDLKVLWRVCGGTEYVEVEGDEEGELRPDMFLPGGVLLGPKQAAMTRLSFNWPDTEWPRAWVAWLGEDQEGALVGRYVDASEGPGSGGEGQWSAHSGPEMSAPEFPSVGSCLSAVAEALESGNGPFVSRRGPCLPGVVKGCLVWEHPDSPAVDGWEPFHPIA